MTALFIADLHLDSSRPATLRAFLSFLAGEAARAEALYILGDLFESWIGDDDDSPLAATVCAALQNLTAVCPVWVMHGNRDFLLGPGFCQRSGCRLLQEPSLVAHHGRRALLMHGDTLCTADTDYLAFRRQVRDPAWQTDFLARPLSERRQIAQRLREGSREASRGKPEAIMDVTPAEVDRAMQTHGVDLLIHGHTHRPATHREAAGQRIVLGDWDRQAWVLRWDAGSPQLAAFPID